MYNEYMITRKDKLEAAITILQSLIRDFGPFERPLIAKVIRILEKALEGKVLLLIILNASCTTNEVPIALEKAVESELSPIEVRHEELKAKPEFTNVVVEEVEVQEGYTSFETGIGKARLNWLRIGSLTTGGIHSKVPYSMKLLNVKAGDKLDVHFEGRLTNEWNRNVLMNGFMILAASPDIASKEDAVDRLTMGGPYNCTPAMHHCPINTSRSYIFKEDFEEIYINVTMGAACNKADGSAVLQVDHSRGMLSGVITRLGGN
jgi:hypothetical protein